MAAAAGPYKEMLEVVNACAARIRWRLRPASKRRLLNDILFLCTGLRPVVLVDYGGTMPQLQENLCGLLYHARQLLTTIEENDTVLELVSIQDQFAAKFPVDLSDVRPGITKQMSGNPQSTVVAECTDNHVEDRTLLVVDLSSFLENTQIALPSLNGWLLGYPVTYLFRNASSEAAIQNLSRQSLHIYRVYVCGSYRSAGERREEELMRYPYVTGNSVIALKYKDGVIMACDTGASYGSTLRYKSVERIKAVGKHSIIGASGEFSDFQEILRYLDELTLSDHMWDDGNSLGPKEIHSYLTRVMYNRRNKFDPLWNSLVLGGVKKGPKGDEKYLGMVNMIGTHFEENHVATGFGNHMAIPILRAEWRDDMTFEEAVKLVEKCLVVLLYRDRSSINKFQIAKITSEGSTIYPPYSLKTYWGFTHFENPAQGAVGSW
ncbi:Proteasome subunit beta type-4 [Zea mays]|uniref:Proteasome subunit beta type-4 n=1 Tax=Zea mays TaxID=4577 RepID=A0A3L6E2L5_MAIZE|nr:Proteasome subunit beta type-4 [Zea mays]